MSLTLRPCLPCAPKARGELAEARFIVKALSLGFSVARPFGDSMPFDFIVRAAGRLWRVQVKSAWSRHGRNSYHFTLELGRTSHRRRPYTASDIDFVAAYTAPDDTWYVIPVREVAHHTQLKITVSPRTRYGKYREAWHLLTVPHTQVLPETSPLSS